MVTGLPLWPVAGEPVSESTSSTWRNLTAIESGPVDWSVIDELAATVSRLWIDIGLADVDRVQQLAAFAHTAATEVLPIVGLESLLRADDLRAWCAWLPGAALSLDLRRGIPVTRVPAWRQVSPLEIVAAAVQCGLERVIVLDLASVGSSAGCPTLAWCRRLRAIHPGLEIITGGGVRGAEDLRAIEAAGADAALVGTWLHRQWREDHDH